jgi:hypothetical protein
VHVLILQFSDPPLPEPRSIASSTFERREFPLFPYTALPTESSAHTTSPKRTTEHVLPPSHASWREKWQSRQGLHSPDQSAPFPKVTCAPFLSYFNVRIFFFLLHHLHLVHPFCFGHLYWWSIASSRHSFLDILLNNLPSCFASNFICRRQRNVSSRAIFSLPVSHCTNISPHIPSRARTRNYHRRIISIVAADIPSPDSNSECLPPRISSSRSLCPASKGRSG